MGMTLACMILRETPYPRRATPQEIRRWCCAMDRLPISDLRSDLPSPLSHVITRMIAREIKSRPGSIEEVIAVLGTCQSQSPVSLPQSTATTGDSCTPHQFDTLKAVGQWLLGERIYSSSNWEAFIASHRDSGTPARLIRLKPDGPIASAKERIIASAERASEFSHPNLVEVLSIRQKNSKPSQADFAGRITAPLSQVILQLMHDDPSMRPSAAELVLRLERIQGNIALRTLQT